MNIFCIEGNIGAGKSTLMRNLQNTFATTTDLRFRSTSFIEENIEAWKNFEGCNLSDDYYENPVKNAFSFQTFLMYDFMNRFPNSRENNGILFMEQSIYSVVHIFSKYLFTTGKLSELDYKLLQYGLKSIQRIQPVFIKKLYYLKTTPETSYKRVVSRDRAEERTVSYDYLAGLHDIHEHWIREHRCYPAAVENIEILDAAKPTSELVEKIMIDLKTNIL